MTNGPLLTENIACKMELIPAGLVAGLVAVTKYWSYLNTVEKKEQLQLKIPIESKKEIINKNDPIVEENVKFDPIKYNPTWRVPTNTISNPEEFRKEQKGIEFATEKQCRMIFETILNRKFPKCWNLIKNPKTNKWLELDGYNEVLNLAWEYQGEQHYKYPHRYWHSEEEFRNSVYRDRVKIITCRKLGIDIIIIPYTAKKILEKFIRSSLIKVAKHNESVKIAMR